MSRALIDHRRAAIRKHLFLLCPNNSGSTYLGNAIARSRSVWSLEREGQHVFGFAGPSTGGSPTALIWGATPDSIAQFSDPDAYDWERTKLAWYFQAQSQRGDAPVFFTKAPPFLLIPDQLAAQFEATSFLLMLRDPYAALEGILRRRRSDPMLDDGEELPIVAARHLVTCFERQRANIAHLAGRSIFFTYEELCADPLAIARRIEALVPELDDLDLSQKLAVKGLYDEELRNMNAEQIARLSHADLAAANGVFANHTALFEHFGYGLRDPGSVRASAGAA